MIFSFVGQKGGSGKSTLAICVASELASRGRNVLLVDADPQQTAVTWHDVASEAGHAVPTVVAMTGTLHKPNQLPKLAAAYQDVVIDTPPRLGDVQRSAMMCSAIAVLPCGPSAPDAWALAESVKTVAEAIDYRPELKAVIVINKTRAGTAAAKEARKALATAVDGSSTGGVLVLLSADVEGIGVATPGPPGPRGACRRGGTANEAGGRLHISR